MLSMLFSCNMFVYKYSSIELENQYGGEKSCYKSTCL